MLKTQGIPHAWGVDKLGESDNPLFCDWLKQRHAEGIEIWHHGNKHDRIKDESWEFRNRDEASQRANLGFTQRRIFEKTGIILRTFGAPYNKTDEVTGKVLNGQEDIKIVYFGGNSPNFRGLMLNDRVNLETKTGVVAAIEEFKKSYSGKSDCEIIVLQGHLLSWQRILVRK